MISADAGKMEKRKRGRHAFFELANSHMIDRGRVRRTGEIIQIPRKASLGFNQYNKRKEKRKKKKTDKKEMKSGNLFDFCVRFHS